MTAETTPIQKELEKTKVIRTGGGGDSVYGIGLIGAWVYYFKRAATTQERIQAFFKGLFWPGFLVYDLLGFLNKE